MKPISQEFFTEFDPLYRTYDKQAAMRRQRELFRDVPGVTDLWDEYNARFKALGNWTRNVADPFDLTLAEGVTRKPCSVWAKHRSQPCGIRRSRHSSSFRAAGPELLQDVH